MRAKEASLRVAFVVGTLGLGGSEKQLVYMARELRRRRVDVQVYSLTRGEFYEETLRQNDVPVHWVGKSGNAIGRLLRLVLLFCRFRPHIVQSMHGFTNLYCTLAAVPFGAVSLGALRNELDLLITRHGRWALWLLRLPDALIVNSEHLLQEVKSDGRMSNLSLNLLPNCIDVGNYRTPASPRRVDEPMAIFVARLVSSKRLDLFLEALSLARKSNLSLRGTVLGDGPELRAMKRRATELGLVPDGVHFVGHCPDPVPWLCKATVMVFCSESEGSPNVILEAMAAGLPVITTAAGDAAAIVEDGTTGYVVPFNDARALADRILAVSASPRLQRRLGEFGRQVVEQRYDIQTLGDRLLSIYHLIARERGKGRALRAFPSHCGAYPINE